MQGNRITLRRYLRCGLDGDIKHALPKGPKARREEWRQNRRPPSIDGRKSKHLFTLHPVADFSGKLARMNGDRFAALWDG